MELYSTTVQGVILKVRRTQTGWEASISGPTSVMNETTAKAMAEKYAADIIGTDIGPIKWTEEHS